MIRYALSCDRGHEFDAWFGSISSYDEQDEAHAITCPSCGSTHVRKSPMAPAVKKRKAKPVAVREDGEHRRTYAFLKDLKAHLKANAEHVGPPSPRKRARCTTARPRRAASMARRPSKRQKRSRRRASRPFRSRLCPTTKTEWDASGLR